MNDEQTRARFESLTLPLMKDAYNLARWLMRNEEDAEDAVQDSFLKAFRSFQSFHPEGNVFVDGEPERAHEEGQALVVTGNEEGDR